MNLTSDRRHAPRTKTTWKKAFSRDWHLYLMLAVPVSLVFTFNYAA